MTTDHPTLDELDACRTGEAEPAVRDHVQDCPACRQRLQRLTRLAGALRGELAETAAAPPPLDAAMRNRIRDEAGRIRRRRTVLRVLFHPVAAAAAAGLLLALGLALYLPRHTERSAALRRGDLDRSGAVDILDAYLLARRLERREPVPAAADLDGDGAVDARDVQLLTERAVAVSPDGKEPRHE